MIDTSINRLEFNLKEQYQEHQKVILMSLKSSSVVWFLFGCVAIVSLITITVPQLKPSGDSGNPKQENTLPQSIVRPSVLV
jgi:hypothetical protein